MNNAIYANGKLWGSLNTVVKTANGPTQTGLAWFARRPDGFEGASRPVLEELGEPHEWLRRHRGIAAQPSDSFGGTRVPFELQPLITTARFRVALRTTLAG